MDRLIYFLAPFYMHSAGLTHPAKSRCVDGVFTSMPGKGTNGQNQQLAGEFVWQLPGNSQQERI